MPEQVQESQGGWYEATERQPVPPITQEDEDKLLDSPHGADGD